MKSQRISRWLSVIAWTLIFALECAAKSEALLSSISPQRGLACQQCWKQEGPQQNRCRASAAAAAASASSQPRAHYYLQRSKQQHQSAKRVDAVIATLRGGSSEDDNTSSVAVATTKTPKNPPLLRRELLAEFIGTFLIVQIGTGAVMSAVYTNSLVGLFQIASVWIIAVTVAICATGSISGAHLNPAISIAFAMVRPSDGFTWRKVVPYSIAQLLGAVVGSATNLLLYGTLISAFEANNSIVRSSKAGIASAKAFGEYFAAPVSTGVAFLAETVGTAILSFVIFSLTNKKNDGVKDSFIPPLIGLTVGALIAVLAPLTQAGFNPARDFGPRIVAWCAGWKTVAFTGAWVYIVGPIIGAVLGAAIADKVLYPDNDA